MKNFQSRALPLLLVFTILVITGFQVFWLKKNYDDEKRTMEVKAGINFRESVYGLQAAQLKDRFGEQVNVKDSFHVEINASPGKTGNVVWFNNTKEVVSMVNILREQEKDSSGKNLSRVKSTYMITDKKEPRVFVGDSTIDIKGQDEINDHAFDGRRGHPYVQLMYGIDSASDTLKITDIKKVTELAFSKEKLDIPFSIHKINGSGDERMHPAKGEVTVGFSKPVTYKLELGNTIPYLFRKLLSPLLFSLFLISVTIASFVLLYRNLLQQKRLAVLKDDFISNVTHELKTPIATVNVALEAMKNFNAINDPVKTRDYLDISQGELQRLSLLVDKVLRISMFENKEILLNTEIVPIDSLISEVAASMRLQFEKKSAVVNIESEGDNLTVKADRLHMMSVVYNLFDNALKYSGDNPLINVKLKDQGDQVALIFSDNGMGIPSAYRERIFEKFFRVPHGDTHNVKGYGLGLSYVAQIVQQHKGNIRVDSEEGKGSTFTIQIPKGDDRS